MRFTAKVSEFVNLFTIANMKGLYNPVVLTVKKGVVSTVAKDAADTTIIVARFKGIEIEDETTEKLVFDPDEMLNTFKLFKSDDTISVNIIDNSIIVANTDEAEINDVVSIPMMDTSVVDVMQFPYKIVKGIPIITNKASGESINFSEIQVTIPVKYLAEIVKRANFVDIHPKIYKLEIDGNKLTAHVGDKNTYQKAVKTTFKVDGTGTGELIFGNGFEEIVQTLSGDITLNTQIDAPAWLTMKADKNIVYVLLAPAMLVEE